MCPRPRRRTWLRWRRHLSRHQKQQQQHWDTHLDKAPSCWVRFRKKGTVSPTAQERGKQKCLPAHPVRTWRSVYLEKHHSNSHGYRSSSILYMLLLLLIIIITIVMSKCSLLWAYLLGVLLTSAEREIDSPVLTSKGEPDLLVLVKKQNKTLFLHLFLSAFNHKLCFFKP